MTITEIAARTRLTRAGARRILLTLVNLGYVRSEGRLFSLSPRILDLGYSYLSSLQYWSFAQSIIEDLSAKLHESCSITVRDGVDVVYVMRVPTRRILTIQLSIGSRLPAYPIAMGRILLGGLTPEELDRYFASVTIKPLTKRTVVDPASLRKIIAGDRMKGWSCANGELEDGIFGIAVPLFDRDGRIIAAMSVATTKVRISVSKAIKTFLPELKKAAEQINYSLKMAQV
jgi:IclR family pca regulon transcriptional regulator